MYKFAPTNQDIVVALGGSFGREAAPQEIAAMWGGWVGDAFRVSPEQRKARLAHGAGAAGDLGDLVAF